MDDDNKTDKERSQSSEAPPRQATDGERSSSSTPETGMTDTDIEFEIKIPKKKASVKWEYRPIEHYQTALKRLGLGYRNHAYLNAQVTTDNGKVWHNWTANLESHIYSTVQKNVKFYTETGNQLAPIKNKPATFSASDRRDAVNDLLHQTPYNPVADFLNGLSIEGYKEEPIDIIGEIFDLNFDDELVQEYGTAIRQYCLDWIALVGKGVYLRTMKPGSNFPFFPVLLGEIGCGKSLIISHLLPQAIAEEASSAGLDLGTKRADRLMECRRGAIIECAEMAGHSKRDVAELKAFISLNTDYVRLPYAHRPEQIPRHFIIIGTTNDFYFLSLDPSGDRRHVPMHVKRKGIWLKTDVEYELPKKMDELRLKFWRWIKYLIEVKKEDASYSHWQHESREIREQLIGVHERRAYAVEHALRELIANPADEYDKTVRMDLFEKTKGIAFQVPPTSTKRSIMSILPVEVASRYTPDYIAKVVNKLGWKTVRREVIDGQWCSIKLPITPED